MFNDIDAVYLAGDFNDRVGDLQDTIDSLDDVPQRVAVDNTVNQYGHHLLDFLREKKTLFVEWSYFTMSRQFHLCK